MFKNIFLDIFSDDLELPSFLELDLWAMSYEPCGIMVWEDGSDRFFEEFREAWVRLKVDLPTFLAQKEAERAKLKLARKPNEPSVKLSKMPNLRTAVLL